MKKLIIISLTVCMVVCLAVAGYRLLTAAPAADRVKMYDARIEDIRAVVEMSTMEFYREVPLKASVGPRHLVARVALTGSVSYNLDSLHSESRGDTLVVTLPRETVTVREYDGPGAYTVIDCWNDRLFGAARFTTAEENEAKRKLVAQIERSLHTSGEVKRARAAAAQNLRTLLPALTGRPVVVVY